jgi:hypothetical protein
MSWKEKNVFMYGYKNRWAPSMDTIELLSCDVKYEDEVWFINRRVYWVGPIWIK